MSDKTEQAKAEFAKWLTSTSPQYGWRLTYDAIDRVAAKAAELFAPDAALHKLADEWERRATGRCRSPYAAYLECASDLRRHLGQTPDQEPPAVRPGHPGIGESREPSPSPAADLGQAPDYDGHPSATLVSWGHTPDGRKLHEEWLRNDGETFHLIFKGRKTKTFVAVQEAEEQPHACKVCGNTPDEHGQLEHGKGCYTQSEDGGGTEYIECSA